MESSNFKERACAQRKTIEKMISSSTPLGDKPLAIAVSFECASSNKKISIRRYEARKDLCDSIHSHSHPSSSPFYAAETIMLTISDGIKLIFDHFKVSSNHKRTRVQFQYKLQNINSSAIGEINTNKIVLTGKSGSGPSIGGGLNSRNFFWNSLSHNCSFAFAPMGRGIDTHRVWEILLMGSIPIVISSPLDRLYSQFPIVIVRSSQYKLICLFVFCSFYIDCLFFDFFVFFFFFFSYRQNSLFYRD
jgi:hypothetical protein